MLRQPVGAHSVCNIVFSYCNTHLSSLPPLYLYIAPSLAVFLENRSTIRTGILNSVQHGIAGRAYSRGLISTAVYRTVTDSSSTLTASQRTHIFLNEVESSINNNSSALAIFVEVLIESDAAYHATLIRSHQ